MGFGIAALLMFMPSLKINGSVFFSTPSPEVKSATAENIAVTPAPVVAADLSVPEVTARAFVVRDVASGTILASQSADVRLLPASTTKIMTALVALDLFKLGDVVTVGEVIADGQKVGLVPGEKMTVENLLYAMLVESGNDAAYALADFDPKGREHFVELMNQKGVQLGLTGTHFTNPAGLDDQDQFTTATDLATLGVAAMGHPAFARIVGTQQSVIFSVDQSISHPLTNLNELLGKIPGVRGIKTGYTEAAGENLVTDVVRDGHELITVVLKSKDRFGDTEKLVNWAYSNFNWQDGRELRDQGPKQSP